MINQNKFIKFIFKNKLQGLKFVLLIILMSFYGSIAAKDFRVGIAKSIITPPAPAWLTGYASREMPAKGMVHDLWAKAMVIEENSDNKVVIITTDLLGLSHEISESVAKKVLAKYGIDRAHLLLNSSHTHSGPMVWPCLDVIADYSPTDQINVSNYSNQLTNVLVSLVDTAISHLAPMDVFYGHTAAGFAFNRREPTENGIINGLNIDGATDHDVPVIKVTSKDGLVKAILFGYACHNTTATGENYLINGDYAGFAQIEIEKKYPGCTAMFMLGCAGDQNPYPRGSVELAQKHGEALAVAILDLLKTKLSLITGSLRCDFKLVDLDFKPVDISTYENDIVGTNKFLQRRAKLMLEAYNKGWKVDKYSYPIQAINFGNSFVLLALGGEAVVDYSLRTKREFNKFPLFVAGYSNEVMCYIPTKKVLQEGGYEAEANMIYYGMPGPFAESVEEKIFTTIHEVMEKIGMGF